MHSEDEAPAPCDSLAWASLSFRTPSFGVRGLEIHGACSLTKGSEKSCMKGPRVPWFIELSFCQTHRLSHTGYLFSDCSLGNGPS